MNALKYLKEKEVFNRTEFGIPSVDSFIKEFIILLKKNNVFSQSVIESHYSLDNRVNIYGFDILKVESYSDEDDEVSYKVIFITGNYFKLDGDSNVDLKIIKRQIEGINRLLRKIKLRRFQSTDVNNLEGLQSYILTHNVVEFDVVYLTDGIITAQNSKLIQLISQYADFSNFEFFDLKTVNDLLNENKFSKINMGDEMFDLPKPCTFVDSEKLSVYTTFFTGSELFELYRKYNRRLYDNNVRLFLDTKRKGNAAMVKTILEKPELFVSFNNGLSIVAESVALNDGIIQSINGLSIVNGGQTLASLYFTGKKYGISSLLEVKIIAKISCLKIHDNAMVSNISRASNTQTAIKNSDFSSNLEEFILFQRFTQWFNLPNGLPGFEYAFFERMQGERNDLLKRAPDNKTRIEYTKKYPSNYSFVKTELSRVCHLILGNISMASNSAEKQFEVFVDPKNKYLANLNLNNYIEILSVVVLFNKFRLYCGKKGSKKHPPVGEPSAGMAITIYALGMFLKNHGKELNYLSIFDEKLDTLDGLIFAYLKESWRVLEKLGGSMLQEKAKKAEFETQFCIEFRVQNLSLSPRNKLNEKSTERMSEILNDYCKDNDIH